MCRVTNHKFEKKSDSHWQSFREKRNASIRVYFNFCVDFGSPHGGFIAERAGSDDTEIPVHTCISDPKGDKPLRSNDFSCVGFIDNPLEPEAELIDGREIESIGFELITEDNRRFECQTDDRQIAFRKLQGIDRTSLYRCKGYFQRIDGHQVFVVEDVNLSTSVPSQTPRVELEVEAKARKRAEPLPPIADLERKALIDTRNLTKVECEALLAHYPERDIRHYALALYMSRRFRMPIPIAENSVECRAGHIFSVGTPGMLFRNRKTYCADCGQDVTVTLTPTPERSKEEKAHEAERASAALDSLLSKGWKAED